MVKLSSGKEICPFLRIVGTENVKVCFNLLIGLLNLSVCLRVCSGELDIVVGESCQFSSKGRCELWASVGYQGIMKSELLEHMVKERFGHSSHIYGF